LCLCGRLLLLRLRLLLFRGLLMLCLWRLGFRLLLLRRLLLRLAFRLGLLHLMLLFGAALMLLTLRFALSALGRLLVLELLFVGLSSRCFLLRHLETRVGGDRGHTDDTIV